MASLGLSIITNDAEAVIEVLAKYSHYFDKYFITIADKDKKQYYDLKKARVKTFDGIDITDKLHLSYFKWQDHFGKAREFNRKQITTDYFMWIDSDDIIENPELIPKVFNDVVSQNLDAVYMKYNYVKNDIGEGIGDHWRERIVKTDHFKWAQTRVHETLIAPSANTSRCSDITILHKKTKKDEEKSMERNIKLLLKDFSETKDPRTAMYLGDNLMYLKMFDEALRYLKFLVVNGGWDEDKYRAWLRIAEIHYQKEEYQEALLATDRAAELKPEFPDAYFLKASIYNSTQEPHKVYEWVKVAMSKPVPETLSVIDPTLYEYRGLFMGALAALELGKIDEAFKLFQIVRERSPDYKLAKDMQPLFEEAYYDNKAMNHLNWLAYYLKDNGGDGAKLLSSLPAKLLADPRLNAVRCEFFKPKKWAKGSVVYYCGRAAEAWGADTLDKGMGGSEEAVVYLSRELAKLGHEVDVFNDREEEYIDFVDTGSIVGNSVEYKPWTLLNPNDEFDTFIAWRAPEMIRDVKARVKLVDLHDTVEPERVYLTAKEVPDVKFFVKSQYHRDLYPELADDRFVIIGNGIAKEQFSEN